MKVIFKGQIKKSSALKGEFIQKWKLRHHLLTLMMFLTCTDFFPVCVEHKIRYFEECL